MMDNATRNGFVRRAGLEGEAGPPAVVTRLTAEGGAVPTGVPDRVEPLVVREFKGPGGLFTPNTGLALTLPAVVHQPAGQFGRQYVLPAGGLREHLVVRRRAIRVAFVPSFDWRTGAVALYPVRTNKLGEELFGKLDAVARGNPARCFVEFSQAGMRHVVRRLTLDAADAEALAAVRWPTGEEILDALQPLAVDDVDRLAALVPDVRTELASEEVA